MKKTLVVLGLMFLSVGFFVPTLSKNKKQLGKEEFETEEETGMFI